MTNKLITVISLERPTDALELVRQDWLNVRTGEIYQNYKLINYANAETLAESRDKEVVYSVYYKRVNRTLGA